MTSHPTAMVTMLKISSMRLLGILEALVIKTKFLKKLIRVGHPRPRASTVNKTSIRIKQINRGKALSSGLRRLPTKVDRGRI